MSANSQQSGATAGGGCLTVFGLPFAVAGLAILSEGLAAPYQRSEPLWVIVTAGCLFLGAGIGVSAFGFHLTQAAKAAARLQALHPDKPWMWRPEWASGRIPSDQRAGLAMAWIFAVFWNTVTSLAAAAAWRDLRDEPFWPLLMLFPLVDVLLLLWAVTETLRVWRHGRAWFHILNPPGVIGGRLKGRVATQLPSAPPAGFETTLTVLQGSASSDSNTEKVVWQARRTVSQAECGREAGGVVVPVEFHIPADASPSTEGDGAAIRWRLSASAVMPGVDFAADFLVPVFSVPDREEPASQFVHSRPGMDAVGPVPFIERPRQDGAPEIYVPAGRNTGAAIGLTVFLAIWLGVLAVMMQLGIHWLFSVAWGLFAVLLVWATLELWFGASRIWFEGDEIVVRRSLLGMGTARRIPVGDVTRVSVEVGMSQGRTMTQQAQAWYDVHLYRTDGRAVTAASPIREQAHAERLARRIETGLEHRRRR